MASGVHRIRDRMRAALYPVRARLSAPPPSPTALQALVHLIERHDVQHLVDVGANRGLFGEAVRAAGYRGQLISFEPLQEAFLRLRTRADLDPSWSCRQLAIGSEEDLVTINVAPNSESSSILPMTNALLEVAPALEYSDTERVEQLPLDLALRDLIATDAPLAIKLDVQGYEHQVLDGAVQALDRARVVQTELSLLPLYEGEETWIVMVERLRVAGFELHALEPMFFDRRTFRTLQVDAVFARR